MDTAKTPNDSARRALRPDEALAITREDFPLAVVLRLSGEVDLENVSQLADAFDAVIVESRNLVVDCAALEYIDSTGFHALFDAYRSLDDRGRLMLVVSPSPPLRRAFDIVKLGSRIAIAASVDEALLILAQDGRHR